MKQMIHRTTFALDHATAQRLRKLSVSWNVSQAEVVRRAVALAETAETERPNAAELLQNLQHSGHGMVREQAEEYLGEVRKGRADWRGEG